MLILHRACYIYEKRKGRVHPPMDRPGGLNDTERFAVSTTGGKVRCLGGAQ